MGLNTGRAFSIRRSCVAMTSPWLRPLRVVTLMATPRADVSGPVLRGAAVDALLPPPPLSRVVFSLVAAAARHCKLMARVPSAG